MGTVEGSVESHYASISSACECTSSIHASLHTGTSVHMKSLSILGRAFRDTIMTLRRDRGRTARGDTYRMIFEMRTSMAGWCYSKLGELLYILALHNIKA